MRRPSRTAVSEERILDFIRGVHRSNGYTPTLMEIAKRFHISMGQTTHKIELLESRGAIARTPNIARGILISSEQV